MTSPENSVNPEMTPDSPAPAPTREEFLEQVESAQKAAAELQASITQKEWLLIRRALDTDRKDVILDGGLRLAALAWVKMSRAHGGASWDAILDMTDDDLLALHGYPTEQPEDLVDGFDPTAADGVAAITEEEAQDKASFCLRLSIAPSEYDLLTDFERLAFRQEADRIRAEMRQATGQADDAGEED